MDESGLPVGKRYTFFDAGTPNGKNASLCSLGFVTQNGDGDIEASGQYLINPEDEFTTGGTRIRGIRGADVREAPTLSVLWGLELHDVFSSSTLVAHNAPLVLGAVKKALLRYDITLNVPGYIDTLRMSKRIYKRLPSYRLDSLSEHLGIVLPERPSALDDAIACREVFKTMESKKRATDTQFLVADANNARAYDTPTGETSLDDLYGILIGLHVGSEPMLAKTSALLGWCERNADSSKSSPWLFDSVFGLTSSTASEKDREGACHKLLVDVRKLLEGAGYDPPQLARILTGLLRSIKAGGRIGALEAECLQTWLLNNNDSIAEDTFTNLFHALNAVLEGGYITPGEEAELLKKLDRIVGIG
jgi:DNA polymerase-3 subunit epsilon